MDYDHLVGYNLIELARKINHKITKELAPVALTFPQYRVLSRLFASGPMSQSELGEYLALSGATLTPMIQAMHEKKWVDKTPDPEDGRRVLLQLTTEGKRMRDAGFAVVMDFETRELRVLGEAESQLLIQWLQELNNHLGSK